MQGESIKRRNVFRKNRVPRDLPILRDQIQRRSRQGGHMQRLANMAGSFRTTIMLVGEGAAGSKIKQRQAA
jgi:hypothetical protein